MLTMVDHIKTKENGWNTLEFGIAVISIFTLITGAYDLVNLFRARSSVSDIADNVVEYLTALPGNTSPATLQSQAQNYAQGLALALYPNAQFNCTGDFCYRYQILNVTQVSTNDSIRVDFSLDFPTMILGGRKTLSASSIKKKESAYAPSQQPQIAAFSGPSNEN